MSNKKDNEKICIKCRKYYKNFKSVTQIKKQRKDIFKILIGKYQAESKDLNKCGIFNIPVW